MSSRGLGPFVVSQSNFPFVVSLSNHGRMPCCMEIT